jgi:hypothetical protein
MLDRGNQWWLVRNLNAKICKPQKSFPNFLLQALVPVVTRALDTEAWIRLEEIEVIGQIRKNVVRFLTDRGLSSFPYECLELLDSLIAYVGALQRLDEKSEHCINRGHLCLSIAGGHSIRSRASLSGGALLLTIGFATAQPP